ncbi:ATP-binding protein (plasmid) [Streptomyces sp. BI20]|uniref:HAMP domain-containing sensor histidine kinase n=1 Tax=Streptomyces sp. BI20 TaxID=3403460 RepID=UPI003C762EEB
MIRRLILSYVALVGVALAAFTVPVAFTLTAQLREDTEESVRREATTMALLLGDGDAPSRFALARVVAAYADETPGTVEVVAAEGRTLPATPALPGPSGGQVGGAGADDHDAAFEAALRSGRTTADWGSRFVWGPELVVTVPAHARDTAERPVVGAVRIRYATSDLTDRLWRIWGFRAVLAVGVLAIAAGLGAIVARLLTKPLRQLNAMASRFSDGDLTARSPVTGPRETRTLARTLNQGAERLDTLLASQRIFIADASHQLRTPLTALRLSLDNVADGVDDPWVVEDVDLAIAEVVRMNRLVNGLLVLARAEAKPAAPEPVALARAVSERLGVWRPAAEERGVRIVWEEGSAPADRLRVLAGSGHLEQVLDNVLSNALEVSPDRAVITVRTDTCVTAGEDTVLVEVADRGPGLPEADRARAFDRFWRGQGLTGRAGSGLGLAVVHRLVTDDGGTVTLEPRADGRSGLCVRIVLRAAPAARTEARAGTWISPRPAAPRSGG